MAPTKKLSPDTAKVSTVRLTEGASVSRKVKIVFYKTVLNTCPSFLNEVKNLAKDTGVKYTFCDYPMPDSSLRVKLCFFFHHHSDSARRSRMTAGVLLVFL